MKILLKNNSNVPPYILNTLQKLKFAQLDIKIPNNQSFDS